MKTIKKIVNMPKLIKTIWFLLWAILIGLVVLKLTFNKWYPIIMEENTFVKICNFIDKHNVLKFGANFILFILTSNIIFLTFIGKWKYKNLINTLIINTILIVIFVIKNFNTMIGSLLDIALILLSIVYNLKNKNFRNKTTDILLPIIIYILLNIWQLNMLFIKDINNLLSEMPTLVLLIVQSDYHIFLIITWIGVNIFMGISSLGWFFGKSDTELKEIRQKELNKKVPDMKIVSEIEKILKSRNVEF